MDVYGCKDTTFFLYGKTFIYHKAIYGEKVVFLQFVKL